MGQLFKLLIIFGNRGAELYLEMSENMPGFEFMIESNKPLKKKANILTALFESY